MKTLKKTLFLIFTLTMLMGMTAFAKDSASPSKATFTGSLKKTSTVYNGKTQKPSVVIKDGKKTLKAGVDYKVVSKASYKNAGKYVVKVEGLGKYAGQKFTKTYTIKKATQSVKLNRKGYTVRASKVKKATQSTSIKVYKKAGKVTFKSSSKYVSVKNGRIYVKKGAKKGTYKIKVYVKSSNYNNGVRIITVRVK